MNNELNYKVSHAIFALRLYEPKDGYYIAYSGGKDSDVIRILAELANVKYELHHNLTTVDAPETVYYVKSIPNVIIDRPERSMWKLIPDKLMPPTRLARYCCSELKEKGGKGKLVVTGVRKAESKKRQEHAELIQIHEKVKKTEHLAHQMGIGYRITKQGGMVLNDDNTSSRRLVEQCYRTRKTMINPIVDWTDEDVWEFLNYYNCKSNPLYQCGFTRVGCVGCPMAGKHRIEEFEKYPKFKNLYLHAFDRMLKHRRELGKDDSGTMWETADGVMNWWLGEDYSKRYTDDLLETEDEIIEDIEHPEGR